jgi:hypothetical protein
MIHTRTLTLGLGFHPVLHCTRRNTRNVVIDRYPQDAVDNQWGRVARLLRRATRGYIIQLPSGAAQHLTFGIHWILGLGLVDSKDVVGELAGRAVDVGCVKGDGVKYNEGAVDERQRGGKDGGFCVSDIFT